MARIQILGLALFLFCGTVEAQTLSSGVWKAVTNFRVDGFPLPASTGEDCVTAAQAADAKGTITKGLDKIGCVITDWQVVNNNLTAALSCDNQDVKAKGTVQGQFTEKSYHLEGQAHGFYKGIIPSVASLTLDGQWLSDCK